MTDLKPRPVLVGSLVDFGGTTIVVGVFFTGVQAVSGVTSAQELDAVYRASTSLQVATLVLGLIMTAIGAYVAARMTAGTERLHAFAVGVVSTAVGFTIVFAAPEAQPFWSQAAGLMLTIPAAFAGGEVRRATAARGRSRP